MPDIHYGLLIGLAAGLCASCATTPGTTVESPVQSTRDNLVIDLSRAVATTSQWSAGTVDCSDQNYHCILIPGRMVLAFAKSCQIAGREGAPAMRYGQLHEVAPAPHLAPPSGGYVISAFPNVLLYYNINYGLNEARVVRHSPYEHDFDPNDYTERYVITTSSGAGLFICSE
jgi:hypothetical protein